MKTAQQERSISKVKALVDDLGERVSRAWRRANYEGTALASVAEAELLAAPLGAELDLATLSEWVVRGDELPFQQSFTSTFGEPPVTLFWRPGFYIEALFWASSTPSIHNHAFTGAFTVLHGSSLQTTYRFEPVGRISEAMSLGTLAVECTEILQKGSVQQVLPRDQLIHAVFHLDSPSVSLVVRSHSERNREGRFAYLPPYVAYDPTVEDQARTRRVQMLRLLAKVGSIHYATLARAAIADGDLLTAFEVLHDAVVGGRVPPAVVDQLITASHVRWGAHGTEVVASVLEARRQHSVAQLRHRVTEPDQRVFLGLLAGQPDWPSIRRCLETFQPGVSPEDAVVEWIRKFGLAGVVPFQLDAVGDTVLRSLLDRDARTDGGTDEAWRSQFSRTTLLRPLFVGSAATVRPGAADGIAAAV
jgi:hypothetical protein